MISVIIPVYKAERTIARCIESVIAQEYSDWELILVDDGSPDRSGELCDEYVQRDARIRVVHQKNQGASSARNRGMAEAQGEFVCFIDADDYVEPSFLSSFLDSEVMMDDIDLSIQGILLTYTDSNQNHIKAPEKRMVTNMYGLLSQPEPILNLLNGPCAKLFRLNIIRTYGLSFPIGLNYGEDGVFVKSYLSKCSKNVLLIPSHAYCYTHEEGIDSLSSMKHDYNRLGRAIALDFQYYKELKSTFKELPSSYVYYYINYKALDYYHSIYECLCSDIDLQKKIAFLESYRGELKAFFSKAEGLPKTYHLIRWTEALLSPRLSANFLSFLFRCI